MLNQDPDKHVGVGHTASVRRYLTWEDMLGVFEASIDYRDAPIQPYSHNSQPLPLRLASPRYGQVLPHTTVNTQAPQNHAGCGTCGWLKGAEDVGCLADSFC